MALCQGEAATTGIPQLVKFYSSLAGPDLVTQDQKANGNTCGAAKENLVDPELLILFQPSVSGSS